MNIVVLAGGISTERDVSIVSGTKVCEALRAKGHRAILLDVYCGDEQADFKQLFLEEYDIPGAVKYIKSFNDQIEEMKKERKSFFGPNVIEICQAAEVVFLALHGANGEDGKVQAAFDLMGITYTGTNYLSSAIAMDKGLSKQLFLQNHIPTPAGCIAHKKDGIKTLEEYGMPIPCVVKVCNGGSSVGVTIPQTEEAFYHDLKEAFELEDTVVLEQFIQGREFSVGVIDGKALPVIEIAPIEGFYDYKNKYQAGSTIETCPAQLSTELTEKMQKYAEETYQVLMMENYARVDFMMDAEGEMYCLEANTLPGMTPTSLLPQEAQAQGMEFPELCEVLIQVSLRKKENE